jgi:hypothetical protein
MNQTIARSGHPSPIGVRVADFKIVRKILDRLANDFQAADKGPLQCIIGP